MHPVDPPSHTLAAVAYWLDFAIPPLAGRDRLLLLPGDFAGVRRFLVHCGRLVGLTAFVVLQAGGYVGVDVNAGYGSRGDAALGDGVARVRPSIGPVFGLESSESTGSRADFDDVDDYNGWTASPPQRRDGTVIPQLDGWGRTAQVGRLDPVLLDPTGVETGVKRIRVTVKRDDAEVASIVAIRTRAWQQPEDYR